MSNQFQSDKNLTSRFSSQAMLLLDITIMLIKLISEIVFSMIKAFIKDNQKDVSGEIVLITGSGHGIGKELVLQYTGLGCEVVCVDINDAENEETVKQANLLRMGTAYGFKCDVTQRDDLLKLSDKIRAEIGNVSVIINNAGVMPSHPLLKHSEQEIRKLFEVNVFANFWVLEAFMPHMISKGRGHIVAISSIAGLCGLNNLVPYCTTKFAIRGLMEALHEEIRENEQALIKTTVVYPFMVDTGLCKQPKFRFPNFLGFISAKEAAKSIIYAHRADLKEVSIPRYLFKLNNILRCLPVNCTYLFKDFMDTGVESDL